MRYPEPYRKKGREGSLYFVYNDPLTGKRRYRATGSPKVGESREIIRQFMDRLTPHGTATFREYAERFFSPDTNPRYIRYKMAGKQYGRGHINTCRRSITKYVFPERFADKVLSEITRGDVLDLIALLMRKYPDRPAAINKVVDFISSIFSEAYYREDLRYNPAQRLSDIEYEQSKRGAFSIQEIRDIFRDPERWQDPMTYCVFMFAAYTGRRRGEIFGLQWSQIQDGYCHIDRAYNRDEHAITSPKWAKTVTIPLCRTLLDRLPPRGDSPYVFTTEYGHPLYEDWWKRHFASAMRRLGIDRKERNLVPHSFRHSLNTNLILALGGKELFVRKYIGWTDNSKDTQAAYTHIEPEHLQFIADKIDEMYSLD